MKICINYFINYIFKNLYFLNNIKQKFVSFYYKCDTNNIILVNLNLFLLTETNKYNKISFNSSSLKELQEELDKNKIINVERIVSIFLKYHNISLSKNYIIDIKYKIKNKFYKINVNNILANSFAFPLYNTIIPSKSINKILFAYVYDKSNNDFELEITNELELYQGPKNNFYFDTEFKIWLKDIILENDERLDKYLNENKYILIQDTFLNEYRIEYPFNSKIELIDNVNQEIIDETINNTPVFFLNKFLNRSYLIRLKDIVNNIIEKF
jgi:hypothetical protein